MLHYSLLTILRLLENVKLQKFKSIIFNILSLNNVKKFITLYHINQKLKVGLQYNEVII